jgi:hypothetical protein
MKAQFVQAANYATKSFNAKLAFVFATAKKLSIKKVDALELADKIEGSTEDQIDLAVFKAQFIDSATNLVKEQMIAKIAVPEVPTTEEN